MNPRLIPGLRCTSVARADLIAIARLPTLARCATFLRAALLAFLASGYPIAAAARDFGDLPDSGAGTSAGDYETVLANHGAFHPVVPTLRLGATVDVEPDGQPNATASGDGADEDGVNTADLALTGGAPRNVRVTVTNTSGASANLCGYVDTNAAAAAYAANSAFIDANSRGRQCEVFPSIPRSVAHSPSDATAARYQRSAASRAPASPPMPARAEVSSSR